MGFCWFGCLSSGEDPVVSSHTCPCRHFTGGTKIKIKQQTEDGRKKQTNTDSEQQNTGRWSMHFFAFCVYLLCVAITRTQKKSYTATKDADSSGHHFHCSVSSFLTPYHPPTALDPRLRADWPAPHLGLKSLTLRSSLTPNWLTSFVLSSGLAGFHRHSSLRGLHTKGFL